MYSAMSLIFTICAWCLLGQLILALDPDWASFHQKDYSILPHKAELKWSNKSYVNMTQFGLVKFNRTYHGVLNVSGNLLKEIGVNFWGEAQFYKKSVTEYKVFPIHGQGNICKEYLRNTFNVKEIVKRYSNTDPCPQKKGHFYVKHADYDESLFPPFIPKGDYMFSLKLYHNSDLLGVSEVYGSIVDPKNS